MNEDSKEWAIIFLIMLIGLVSFAILGTVFILSVKWFVWLWGILGL